MAQKNIFICRHSQAEHNVADDYSIPDAPLTELGKAQSAALPSHTQQVQSQVDVILSSPLRRTLQSTRLGWAPAVQRLGGLKKVVCLPQLQECNDFPCDTGSPASKLLGDAEFNVFDLSRLTPDWTSKRGFYAPDHESLMRRARWVRQHLRSRPEKNVLVVAHGDIIRRITAGPQGPSTSPWRNAEVRLFRFDPRYLDSDECFLEAVGDAPVAAGYDQTSTQMPAADAAAAAAALAATTTKGVQGGASLLGLPKLDSGAHSGGGEGGADDDDDLASSVAQAGNRALEEIEERVKSKQSQVASQADELARLEERLAQAEQRKRELEAKGVRV